MSQYYLAHLKQRSMDMGRRLLLLVRIEHAGGLRMIAESTAVPRLGSTALQLI